MCPIITIPPTKGKFAPNPEAVGAASSKNSICVENSILWGHRMTVLAWVGGAGF